MPDWQVLPALPVLPGWQQGCPTALPQDMHICVVVLQVWPVTLQVVPKQQGWPAPPHDWQVCRPMLQAVPDWVQVLLEQQGWLRLPHGM